MEFLEGIKSYWFIIIAFIGLISAWAEIKFQNRDQERRLNILEGDNCTIKKAQTAIEIRLAEIQKDISWIRETLTK